MDKCSPCGSSMHQGENSEVVCDDSVCTDDSSMQIMSTGLTGKLQINGGNRMNITNDVIQFPIEGHHIEEDEDEEEDDFSEEELLVQMGYEKSKPKRNTREPQRQHYAEEVDTSDHVKNETPMPKRITAPMMDIKLVSALKGSREKQGKSGNECRVSWAPDAYDPSPSAEYFALNGPERRNSEHVKGTEAVKNRQKGVGKGSSKGGKAARKDKKQAKNQGGRDRKFPDYSES